MDLTRATLSQPAKENLFHVISHAYVMTAIARACDLLFMLALFSWYSPEQVGLFSVAIAVAAIFMAVLDLGLTQTLVRGFGQGTLGFPETWRCALRSRLPILLFGTASLLCWHMWWHPSAETFWVIAFAGTIQALLMVEWFCHAWLKGHCRQSFANTLASFDPLGRLGIVSALHYFSATKQLAPMLGLMTAMHVLLAIISCASVIRHRRLSSPPPYDLLHSSDMTQQLFWSGLTFGAIGIITVIQNRVDWLLVSSFGSATEVANYALANKVYEVLLMGLGVTMSALYPRLCRETLSEPSAGTKLMMTGIFVSGVVFSLIGSLYGPDVLHAIWQEKFSRADPLIRWLLPLAGLASAIMVLYNKMAAKHMERALLRVSVLATSAQLVVNGLAIPRLGSAGAVAGMATLIVANLVLYVRIALHEKLLTTAYIKAGAGFVSVMWTLAFSVGQLQVPVGIGAPILFTVGTMAAYRLLLDEGERARFHRFIEIMSVKLAGAGVRP